MLLTGDSISGTRGPMDTAPLSGSVEEGGDSGFESRRVYNMIGNFFLRRSIAADIVVAVSTPILSSI